MAEADKRRRLGAILVDAGLITAEDVARALAEQTGVQFVNPVDAPVDLDVARLVPQEVARSLLAVPLHRADGTTIVAVADPTDEAAFRTARAFVGSRAAQRVATPAAVEALLDRVWAVAVERVSPSGRTDHRPDEWAAAVTGAIATVEDPLVAAILGPGGPGPEPEPAAEPEEPVTLAAAVPPAPAAAPEPDPEPSAQSAAVESIDEGPSLSAVRRLQPALTRTRRDAGEQRTLDLPKTDAVALARLAVELVPTAGAEIAERLLAGLVARGLAWAASRVELLVSAEGLQVRYRIDGDWQAPLRLPALAGTRVLAALDAIAPPTGDPVMAQSYSRLPARWDGRAVELRVVTQERAARRRTVLTVRDPASALDLDALGAPLDVVRRLRQWSAGRQGLVLVAGPPDSGRTTTLYALARYLSGSRRTVVIDREKAWDLPGLDVIGRDEHGLSLGDALSQALQRDPRVLVVDGFDGSEDGLRLLALADRGVLVVLGVDGLTAAEALDGLRRRGVPDALLGEPVLGIVEHRLVRLVCPKCSTTGEIDERLARLLGLVTDTMGRALRIEGPGCAACHHAGYRGRRSVFTKVELPGGVPAGVASQDLDSLLARGRDRSPAQEAATLVAQGRTTLREVARALGVRTVSPVVSVQSPKWTPGMSAETVDGAPEWDREELSLDDLPAGGEIDPDDRRLVVLAVGDSERAAAALVSALPAGEFRVARVLTVEDALVFVREEAPSTLALGSSEDGRACLALVRKLRASPETAFLPLLVLDDSALDAMDLLRAGADDVLPPGAPPDEIEQALREVLHRGA